MGTSAGAYLCGGSIYNASFIITAAHCIVDETTGTTYAGITTTVTAGDLDKATTGETNEQKITV